MVLLNDLETQESPIPLETHNSPKVFKTGYPILSKHGSSKLSYAQCKNARVW